MKRPFPDVTFQRNRYAAVTMKIAIPLPVLRVSKVRERPVVNLLVPVGIFCLQAHRVAITVTL